MKDLLRLVSAFVLLAASPAQAQSPGRFPDPPSTPPAAGKGNPTAADQAWSGVDALIKSAAAVRPTPGPKTPQQAKVDRDQKASGFRQTAQAAKDFYLQHPNHPQVPAAKKLEALAGIAGITDDDAPHEKSALKVASDFRTNKGNPISDRFEVAHAMERHDVSRKLGGKHWLSSAAEADKLADRLRTEFGHLPAVYSNYLTVAENTNCDNSGDVARRILRMPAPAEVKAGAQRVLDRHAMLRKPLDFPLTTDKGKSTTLGKLAGKLTVVCLWDGTTAPGGPPGLHEFRKTSPPGTEWIYVSLGAPGALSKGTKPRAMPRGTICVEPLGRTSPLAAQLKITRLPHVLVLDEKKNLSGFGRIDELPWLLAGTHRLFEP